MATMKEIKRRITSVKNTKKITKAMELVAASKMRKAVNMTLGSRDYAQVAWDILQSLRGAGVQVTHPLLETDEKKTIERVAVVLITSNRGLCGAFNAKAIKHAHQRILALREAGHEVAGIAVGKKASEALARMGVDIHTSFNELPDHIDLAESNTIGRLLIAGYENGDFDRVVIVYTDFVSTLEQQPRIKQLIPLKSDDLADMIHELDTPSDTSEESADPDAEYIFEPSPETVVPYVVESLTLMQVYQALLESRASEHSARMMAMKNASEAAGEMIDGLTLVFNKARQAGITQEISEISAGMGSTS